MDFTRFDAFASTFEAIELVGLGFLILIAAEAVWDIATRSRRFAETGANVMISIGNHLLERTSFGVVFVLGVFVVESLLPWRIPMTAWSWGLAFLAADVSYYWMHRFEHEVRILWSYHSVHHSSPEYNLSTSLRLAWIEGAVEWVFFVPMILVGFDAVQTILCVVIVVVYQTWIHTERVGKLGVLDQIFNTPSVHRVHHGSNEKYLDKNYGGVLMIWDHLFGTFQEEERDEPVVFGITKPIETSNPLWINVHEVWQIIRDVRTSRGLREALGFVFGRPGWTPEE